MHVCAAKFQFNGFFNVFLLDNVGKKSETFYSLGAKKYSFPAREEVIAHCEMRICVVRLVGRTGAPPDLGRAV